MPWYFFFSYFVGGAFLPNSIRHFPNGISAPSFRVATRAGLSSALV
jgi:hypothetical protein